MWEEREGEKGRGQRGRKEEKEVRRPQRKWLVKESQSKSSYSKPTKASGFFNLVHFILKGQFVYTVYFELFEICLPNHWVCNFRGGLSNLAGKYPTSVSHGMNDMKEKKKGEKLQTF